MTAAPVIVLLHGVGRRGADLAPLTAGLKARGTALLVDDEDLVRMSTADMLIDLGYEVADIDASTADWLLEWCAFRLRERDEFPRLELVSDTTRITLGSSGRGRKVRGSSAELLGWLTGRAGSSALHGSGGLQLPAF